MHFLEVQIDKYLTAIRLNYSNTDILCPSSFQLQCPQPRMAKQKQTNKQTVFYRRNEAQQVPSVMLFRTRMRVHALRALCKMI